MKKIFSLLIIIVVANIHAQVKELTVQEIFSNRSFFPRGFGNVKWISDAEKYSYTKFDTESKSMSIYVYDIKNDIEELLVKGSDLKPSGSEEPIVMTNYEWSPDEKYILFTGSLPARSLKTGGAFYIYDVEKKIIVHSVESEHEQINISFSPDSKKIAFVRNYNILIFDLTNGMEKQLTFDGNPLVLNGVFDWVYEEEFSVIKGYDWSPDSKSIAYWQLDQTYVPAIQIAKWDSLYFNFHEMRYPKSGATNSTVNIGVVDLENAKTKWMDIGEEKDIYVARINFTANPDLLSIQRLNRLQNKLDFILAERSTGKSKIIFSETDSCWVDVHDNLRFLNDKKTFLWTSEKDGFNHIYIYDYNGKQVRQLTRGNFEVDAIQSVDEKSGVVFFSSNERGTIYHDLYAIKFDGYGKMRLTIDAGYHSVSLSQPTKYYIDRFSTANKATITTLYSVEGKKLKELSTSDMKFAEEYGFSPVENLTFTTSDGISLNAQMIKPHNFDPDKKYPVLIYNYSGPGSQIVSDRWGGFNLVWHQLLAQKGYVIFMLDNRGTGGRGKSFKNVVYKNLGKWEVNDMIEGAKYLSSLGFVDVSRIGIWGWSYGGYMSALTLMRGHEYFKAAISVAPVTHWKFYDTIYTERFMSLPSLNVEGYENTSVLSEVKNLKGKLLLVHGTADDNVHFQNAVVLVNELIKENKQFQTMYYPEKDHGIYGGKTREQLYTMMTNFILENL